MLSGIILTSNGVFNQMFSIKTCLFPIHTFKTYASVSFEDIYSIL